MKHMWSEEELQEIIPKGSSRLDDIVDSKGNKRFIGGEGISTITEELTLLSIKWALNGNNLIFEISGLSNIEIINTRMKICEFALPEYIASKIDPLDGPFDVAQGIATNGESEFYPLYLSVEKLGNSILFFLIVNGTLKAYNAIKIKYSIIVNE